MKLKLYAQFLVLLVLVAVLLQSCGGHVDVDDKNIDKSDGTSKVFFDITRFADVSSQTLKEIMGEPDDVTEADFIGFAEFPYTVYDYNCKNVGLIQFDLINDRVTALTITGELPYNSGNILETLNVDITNKNNITQDEIYIKYEIPTDNIDLIHATMVDPEGDIYKQLTVQYDSRYYTEWNLPIFAGTISPGEYRTMVEMLVKSVCQYPRSASFPVFDWNYRRNDFYFHIESYVDAENAFGGKARHYFSVDYYNDTSTVAYFVFDGEVVFDNGYISTPKIISSLVENGGAHIVTPPTSLDTEPYQPMDCVLYTEVELPVILNNSAEQVIVDNIEYCMVTLDKTNYISFCISFDLSSDDLIENFCFSFSLVGESTGFVREYVVNEDEEVNVYGNSGCYLSLDNDFIGDLPFDNYTIVFKTARGCEHNYGEWHKEIPATCTEDGVCGFYQCSQCKKYFDCDYNEISDTVVAKGHKFEKNICAVCGYIHYSEGLKFEISDTRDYCTVVGIGTCVDKLISIPPTYKGKAVTHIGDSAFTKAEVDQIVIPDSIIYIGQFAFQASKVKNITIPSSVKDLGYATFFNCYELISVEIQGGLDVPDRAFWGCSKLETVMFENGMESIGDEAFCDCASLREIRIPRSVKSIDRYAFCDCKALESIKYDGTFEEWLKIEKASSWDTRSGEYFISCADGIY